MVTRKGKFEENVKKSFLGIKEEISFLKQNMEEISQKILEITSNQISLNAGLEKKDKEKKLIVDEIIIKDKKISKNKQDPIFFVGEIGINHNGDPNIAKQMIDLAIMNGADAVKFQKRTPELCVPEHQKNKPKDTPWGEMTYFEYKKRIEFGRQEYDEINRYCRERKIIWSASPWDIPSIEFLEKYDLPFYKIPSAKLTDKDYLLRLKKTGKPIFLSSGMSTEKEIKKAVEILKSVPLVILHCNSGYPAKDENLNLGYIKKLKEIFPDKIIGYSGHELGVAASLVAGVLGARVIERHITLDRALWGTDQAASLDYNGIKRLVRDLKKLPIWMGEEMKIISEDEINVKKKLRDKDTLFE